MHATYALILLHSPTHTLPPQSPTPNHISPHYDVMSTDLLPHRIACAVEADARTYVGLNRPSYYRQDHKDPWKNNGWIIPNKVSSR